MASTGDWFLPAANSSAVLLVVGGCTAPVVPELVLGVDIPAAIAAGQANEGLGSLVATDGANVATYSTGTSAVSVWSLQAERLWQQTLPHGIESLWMIDGDVFGWSSSLGLLQISEHSVAPIETDGGPVCPVQGEWVAQNGAAALVCDDAGQRLWTHCASSVCTVMLDEEMLAEGLLNASVGFLDGVPCWSEVLLADDPRNGDVHCLDGTHLKGLEGDHLGANMGGGWVSGVFNKWIVPPRLRMVQRDGTSWTLDRARERSGVQMDAAGSLTVIGVPGYSGEFENEGRLYIVE